MDSLALEQVGQDGRDDWRIAEGHIDADCDQVRPERGGSYDQQGLLQEESQHTKNNTRTSNNDNVGPVNCEEVGAEGGGQNDASDGNAKNKTNKEDSNLKDAEEHESASDTCEGGNYPAQPPEGAIHPNLSVKIHNNEYNAEE